MRIRSIKPDFWQDERLARDLSRDARLVYVALWNEADDEGRMRGNPCYLQGALFPYDPGPWFAAALQELTTSARAMTYEVDGASYYYLPKLLKHQRINRPSLSRLPAPPPQGREHSHGNHGEIMDGSSLAHEVLSEGSQPRARARELGAGSREGERGGGTGEGEAAPAADAAATTLVDQGAGRKPTTNHLKPIYSTTPKDGLDGLDRCRRGFAIGWVEKYGTQYPNQSEKDRRAAQVLLRHHKATGVAVAWPGWVKLVFDTYLAIDDDPLLSRERHPMALIPMKLAAILAGMQEEQ